MYEQIAQIRILLANVGFISRTAKERTREIGSGE